MIQAIKELNFPPYATLSQATATMHDMGDRTITADIKIDGAITPDFSYDWEVEFKGDKYIQPLRKPQGSKGDKSSMSTINLTFYHWAIYQLKRYFFVELASTQAGTAFADKYIVPLSVNLGEFVVVFSNVLSYYFPDGDIYIDLNPDWAFDAERKYIDINNTYLWDVLQKTHGLFGVRWVMDRDTNGKYAIRIGYPAGELTHIFEYGFKGGLLNIERQVQDANIRNKILGRGGSKNIPYLYFKDFDKYPQGGDGNQGMIPDPDAIPELANIYFSELRDSNFRSYVQGWKTNANRLLIEGDTLDEFDAERAETDYAYMRGATDTKFDPVEYVKDDASIAEYGELVGRLENNEDIYPSLQGMNIELTSLDGNTFVTKADEVVAVQEVNTDSIASDEAEVNGDIKLEAKSQTSHGAGSNTFTASAQTITVSSDEIEVPEGYEGTLFDTPTIKYTLEWKERIKQYMQYRAYSEGDKVSANTYKQGDNAFPTVSYKVIDVITNKEVTPVNVPEGRYRVDYTLNFPSVTLGSGIIHAQQTPSGLGQTERLKVYWLKRNITTSAAIICKSFNGDVILNKVDGVAISESVSVDANSKATVSITGDTFSVPAQGAIMVDVPISVTPAATTTYSEKTIKVVNVNTNEIIPATNIPQGDYKLLVDVTLINESSSAKTLKVELLPANLYFADTTEKWEPTFDVWIKNIFNTKKSDYASEAAYVEGVWSPLRTEDEMVLTFSSGNLSGHDGWEFKVKKDGIAYDNSRVIVDANGNEVRSEWRLTLIKSDAELETIKKYIPYKDFNAKAGDTFFFTGIILPHQYVLSAEKDVTSWKQDNLAEVKDIKPQWVISLDKVRAHREDADRLIDLLHVGAVLTLKDQRFTKNVGERQILQSITFEWHETSLLPAVDVVLSDKVTTSLSTTAMLQGKVDALARQVGGLSNLEQIIRKVGDLLYLRKDGFEDTSFSPTKFADTVSSHNFRPGAIGGSGWGAYTDENGSSVIEADKLFIRNEMQVNSLIVNQIAALGGTKILSAADMTVSRVETVVLEDDVVGERCYFETRGASKANLFAVDDIAYSNMFDSENKELKYYKRRVIETGPDYITLSTTDMDGNGAPQEGDVIVQFGNFTDATRQSFIIIDPLNGGKIEVYAGVDSFNLTGCNMAGMGVNPTTQEAFLYGYGDMFFGDRKLESDFITYQKKAGETKRSLNINATVNFSADSTGLSNLEEWKEVQTEISGINKTIEQVQDQIDGVVENWNGEGTPTLTNEPAVNWLTDAEKIAHINDTYINIEEYVDDETTPTAGQAWRWCKCTNESITDFVTVTDKDGETFNLHWHPIADSDAVRALKELATKADRSDLEVLTKNLKDGSTIVDGGLVMTSLVAVRNNEEEIEAFLNGSTEFRDDKKGKLILAAGIPEESSSKSEKLADRVPESKTKIYENGRIETNDIHAEGGLFENVKVLGSSRSPFMEGAYYNIELETEDNHYNYSTNSANQATLKKDISQSGRIMTFSGSFWIRCVNGYIYDRGKSYYNTSMGVGSWSVSQLHGYEGVGDEFIRLMAVPITSSEVAWVVIERRPIDSQYSDVRYTGQFAGLRPRMRTITSGDTLSKLDHSVMVICPTSMTIKLPKDPEVGQEYELYMAYMESAAHRVTINGNGTGIQNPIGDTWGHSTFEANPYGVIKLVCALDQHGTKLWWFYRLR